MPKYGLISRIGQGAQGVLIKARVIETGETVAIKRIYLKNNTKNQIDVLREISCLRNCNHKNILKLNDIFFNDNIASLVTEYIESNFKLVINDKDKPQNDLLLSHYFVQIFSGVDYLHKLNIMHRDLKPENILVTLNNVIKIADFGLACIYVPDDKFKTYSHQVVTRWYRAPELLFGSITYNPKIDIWALGCIIVEYINGSPLFMGLNDIDQLVKVFSILGTPNDEIWPGWSSLPDANKIIFEENPRFIEWKTIVPTASNEILNVIKETIHLNPGMRPSADKCLNVLKKIEKSYKTEINYKPPLSESKNNKSKNIVYNRDLDLESFFLEFEQHILS